MILTILLFLNTIFASEPVFLCREEALKQMVNFSQVSNIKEFLDLYGEVYSCKTKDGKTEIMQWGDGSYLLGVEYEINESGCMLKGAPYDGQDDGDLDLDWTKANCIGW